MVAEAVIRSDAGSDGEPADIVLPELHVVVSQMCLCPEAVAVQHHNDFLPDRVGIGAEPNENLSGYVITFADQPQQEVLGAGVVMAELQRFPQRQLQDLLGPQRVRDVPVQGLLPPADRFLDLLAGRFQADPEPGEHLPGNAVTLADQPQQDVLSADVVMIEIFCFFLR